MEKKKALTMLDIFHQIDTGGNGSISAMELQVNLEKEGFKASAITSLFAAADTNKDGQIGVLEWTNATKKFPMLITGALAAMDLSGTTTAASPPPTAAAAAPSSAAAAAKCTPCG